MLFLFYRCCDDARCSMLVSRRGLPRLTGMWSDGRLARPAGKPRSRAGTPGAPPASAFLHRHIFLWVDRADVIGARANQPVIVELFDDVRGPAADPRDREDGREQVHIDAERVVGGSR